MSHIVWADSLLLISHNVKDMQKVIDQTNALLAAHGFELKHDQLDLLTIEDAEHEQDLLADNEDGPSWEDPPPKDLGIQIQGVPHKVTPKNTEGITLLGNQ